MSRPTPAPPARPGPRLRAGHRRAELHPFVCAPGTGLPRSSPDPCVAHRACCGAVGERRSLPASLGTLGPPLNARSPPRVWFKDSSGQLPHPRHHRCGSWGPGPFVLLRVPMGLLAGCGRSAAGLCRHVDISTVVHRGRSPSTCCPLDLPARSPPRAPTATDDRGDATVRWGRMPGRARIPAGQTHMEGSAAAAGMPVAPGRWRRTGRRGEMATTRSPQPVHISGDNSSTCRPW
jgi:hypothetical protein